MEFSTRRARPADLDSISEWTQDTFEWGDYIVERFNSWLEDPTGDVIVCVDDNDIPVALANARMLSPTEGWLEGARVHPDHQRSGMGTTMNAAGVEWARERGARVVRLAIEWDNKAANRQVEKLGYRRDATFAAGFLDDPAHRAEQGEILTESQTADVDSAWMSWSTSDLARAGRTMINDGWQWRAATASDLETAVYDGRLLQSRHGWVIQRDLPTQFETNWVATTTAGLPGLLEGVIDRAAGGGHDHMVIKIPSVDWVREAMVRAGFSVKDIHVYYLPT